MLPLLLAQADPNPAALAQWLSIAMYLIVSAASVVGLLVGIKSLRSSDSVPQPLEVKAHAGVVGQDDLTEVHGRISRERREIDAQIKELQEEDRRLREKHDKEIRELHDRIDDVPPRTIELLKNTKGLI